MDMPGEQVGSGAPSIGFFNSEPTSKGLSVRVSRAQGSVVNKQKPAESPASPLLE